MHFWRRCGRGISCQAEGRSTATGKKYPQTAGWSFWRYRNEAGELEKVHELRLKYLAQTDS